MPETAGQLLYGVETDRRINMSSTIVLHIHITITDGNWHWDCAESDTVAFIDEHMKMAKYNFDFEGTLLNKIMSPGRKLFESMF